MILGYVTEAPTKGGIPDKGRRSFPPLQSIFCKNVIVNFVSQPFLKV